MNYDFAGWVTKNDIRCSDGVTIKRDAFAHNDKAKVPLVWNHTGHQSPENVIGHVILHNKPQGVYGYGFFNNTPQAQLAKEDIEHGDISAMSIAANSIKKRGSDVIHGNIYEVSLVLAGANPGAMIDEIINHSDDPDNIDSAIIYTGNLVHAFDDVLDDDKNNDGGNEGMDEKSIQAILDGLTEDQQEAVGALIDMIVGKLAPDGAAPSEGSTNEDDDKIKQSDDGKDKDEDGKEDNTDTDNQDDKEKGGNKSVKHNAFDGQGVDNQEVLEHAQKRTEILQGVLTNHGSLKQEALAHGITNIEKLFPDAKADNNGRPIVFGPHNTEAQAIVDAVSRSPLGRIKTVVADLTEDEARARGYIKGEQKLEQIFPILTRETTPQTVYKKQKLDRDDIIDIEDFDIVPFIQDEMKQMLIEELARAILVGDGREVTSKDKIKEDKIRPIVTDDDFYALKGTFDTDADFMEALIMGATDLQGSGAYTLYINPKLYGRIKLLKGTDGRFLYGDIPTDDAMATRFGVSKIVATNILPEDTAVVVNLSDYRVGSAKGGEITNFEDFDIDFNQYKYLIETRLSGALVLPHSALVLKKKKVTP